MGAMIRVVLNRLWVWLDYTLLLPLLALTPYRVGRYLAKMRGVFYAKIRRDWRSFCLGDKELFERTLLAYSIIKPQFDDKKLRELVKERCAMQSIEEWEGACVATGRTKNWSVEFEGEEVVKESLKNNPKTIFLTAHFGCSIVGSFFLGRLCTSLLLMTSNVVEGNMVNSPISRYYKKKYLGIGKFFRVGGTLHREGNTKQFVKFLKNGGCVIVVGDLPPNPNEKPLWSQFFGRERGFASGAKRLAELVGAVIIPFVCVYEDGRYVLKFGIPNEDPYRFLEAQIEKNPTWWWAADMLPALAVKKRVTIG